MRLSEFIAGLQADLDARGDAELFYTWEGIARTPYLGPRPTTGQFDDGPTGQSEGLERYEGAADLDCNWRP